jgi:osmoprotectant transport system ATP-binding protein
VIVLEEVSASYGGTKVLSGVTLHVGRGERVALVGSSGCGKSTLLRVVLGLVTPDSGRVTVVDTAVSPATVESIRLKCGYVIQDGGLFPHLTVLGNVVLVASRLGWKPDRQMERARALFDLVGLAPELSDRYPRELSGGQRQRVGLMRALMLDPDVLLMDEPLGALDPVLRSRMQRDLLELFLRLKKTVLLVTHDMQEAAFLADEIAVMQKGRILQRGPFEQLVAHPADPFVTELVRPHGQGQGSAEGEVRS